MIRRTLIVTCVFFFVAMAAADDVSRPEGKVPGAQSERIPPPRKLGDDENKKSPERETPAAKTPEDDEAQILERLTKNSKSAEDRLADADPGDKTQKLQHDVLTDIDELIKRMKQQQQQSQSSQSSSSSSSTSSPSSSSSSGRSSQQQQRSGGGAQSRNEQRERRRQQQQAQNSSGSQSKKQPGGPAQKSGEASAGKQPMPMGAGGTGSDAEKSGSGGTGARAGGKQTKEKEENKLGELYKDVWGHLPEKMRMEMDSYFKDRFMPRYNDLLKQYYSTIAEQNKKK
jgi:hypothetical protein